MSYDAEMAVLGGMILDKECAGIAVEALTPEIIKGLRTFESVPEPVKEQVKGILEALELPELAQ